MALQIPGGVFDLLAALSVVSLAIERIVEFVVAQVFPAGPHTALGPGTESRRLAAFALACVLGMLAASQAGLGLLGRLNPHTVRWFDAFFTGLMLAAGTQPIHAAVRLLEMKKDSPRTTPVKPPVKAR
ncbi:MAG: hypothetical protein ACM3X6_01260 [Patescibacteria group bacterium]